MQRFRPDILVTSPDGECLMVVEVKLNDTFLQDAIEQLKRSMTSIDCSVGLAIVGDRITLLRDSLREYNGASIYIAGEAKLPNSLLPSADEQYNKESEFEFESRVQNWLEKLKLNSSADNLPSDLKKLFSAQIINLLRMGEVRAAHPRWSNVSK